MLPTPLELLWTPLGRARQTLERDGFHQALMRLEDELQRLFNAFEVEVSVQGLTDEEHDLANQVLSVREALPPFMEQAYSQFLESPELDVSLGEIHALLSRLAQALQALREAETRRPHLHPIPQVQALLRAALAVRAGRLDWEALGIILGRAMGQVSILATRFALQACFDQASADLYDALRSHQEGLVALEQVVLAHNLRALDATLLRIEGEATLVYQTGLTWQEAQVRLKAIQTDDGLPPGGRVGADFGQSRPLPPHLVRLLDAGQGWLAGQERGADFKEALDELRLRTRQSLDMLERLDPPVRGCPQDEVQAWEEAQTAIEDSLSDFFRAIECLEQLQERPETRLFGQAAFHVTQAVERMREVGPIWERVLAGREANHIP